MVPGIYQQTHSHKEGKLWDFRWKMNKRLGKRVKERERERHTHKDRRQEQTERFKSFNSYVLVQPSHLPKTDFQLDTGFG